MSTNTKDPYDMSDEELEEAFRLAKAELEQGEGSDESDVDTEADPEEAFEGDANEEGTDDDELSEDDEAEEGEEDLGEESTESDEEESSEEDEKDEDSVDDDKDAKGTKNEEDVKEDKPVTHKVRAIGKEYEFTETEMMEQFPKLFAQAMDYTKKSQAIKPWRRTIDAIEKENLTHEDINFAISLMKGDKGAIAELVKRHEVDPLELNPEEQAYKPVEYGRDNATLDLHDVLDTIKQDPEYTTTHQILSRTWDDRSWSALSQDPEKIRLLHIDVKNGTYDKLAPIAEKLKVYDRGQKSDLDYYLDAARDYWSQSQSKALQQRQLSLQEREQELKKQARTVDVQTRDNKRTANKQAAQSRRAAAPTGRSTNRGAINYLDASDEEFEDWYKRLEERM